MKNPGTGELRSDEVCLTFDDNLLCQTDVALPVLEKLGVTAFWFVYTSPLRGVKEKLEIYRYFRSTGFANVEEFYRAFDEAVHESRHRELVVRELSKFDPATYLASFSFYTLSDRKFRFTRDQILGARQYFEVMDSMVERAGLDLDRVAKRLWNSADKIKYLQDTGHVVGLHSHTHPTEMRKLEREEQAKEYGTNLECLRSFLTGDIFAMSHPCNSYSDTTIEVLRGLGVDFGFRANLDGGYHSSLEHPRIDHALLIDVVGA